MTTSTTPELAPPSPAAPSLASTALAAAAASSGAIPVVVAAVDAVGVEGRVGPVDRCGVEEILARLPRWAPGPTGVQSVGPRRCWGPPPSWDG